MPERLRAEAVLLDIDGTLLEDDVALPGAVEAVRALRTAGMPLRFVTNTTRRPARSVAEGLRRLGIDANPNELITPAVAATRWLQREGLRRIALYLPEGAGEDFDGLEIGAAQPEAIVVGDLGPGWSFDRLGAAFDDLLRGARLIALHRNRYWRSGGRLVLDAGPFVAALEFAAQVEATVVGKPTRTFFELACASLGMPPGRVVMVGDDVQSDVVGAQVAGLRGVLVRTGKFTEDAVVKDTIRPDATIEDISVLPRLLFADTSRWF